MDWQRPSREQLWQAIKIYLDVAYSSSPPAPLLQRLEPLRDVPDEHLYNQPVFERRNGDGPARYALRLGNRYYPHMKLSIDRAPDGGHLFTADTHDGHCLPAPGSPEYAAVCSLLEKNKQVAAAIQAAWEHAGIRTFKSFLRHDLEQRRQR